MLEFETEELSLQLVASSETHKYRTYWINEIDGLVDLLIVTGDPAGTRMASPPAFKTVAEAIKYANDQEKLIKATR